MLKTNRSSLGSLTLVLGFAFIANSAIAAPPCKSADSDPDGDGWGWENEASCKVGGSESSSGKSDAASANSAKQTATPAESSKPSSGRIICQRTDSDPDGDGWGWENEKSCKVKEGASTPPVSKAVETKSAVEPKVGKATDQPLKKAKSIVLSGAEIKGEKPTPAIAPAKTPTKKAKLVAGQTPVASYGKLSVCGTKLCSEKGEVVQLRGMSSHGIHWFPWNSCTTDKTMDLLAKDWKNDVFRIAMYVNGGKPQYKQYSFLDNEQKNIDAVNKFVEEVSKRGMYALVDFHVLSENPRKLYTEHAKRFFQAVVTANKDRENVIYEIANEPTKTTWEELREYSHEVIPVIRKIDPDAVIVIGTRQWSSFNHGDYMEVVNNQVNAENIMYAFHAYAPDKSHQQRYLDIMVKASKLIPIFVTEWGSTEASGQHEHSDEWGQKYVDAMKEHDISWAYWNFSSDAGGSSIWKNNYCWEKDKDWSDANLKPSGHFIKKVFGQ